MGHESEESGGDECRRETGRMTRLSRVNCAGRGRLDRSGVSFAYIGFTSIHCIIYGGSLYPNVCILSDYGLRMCI